MIRPRNNGGLAPTTKQYVGIQTVHYKPSADPPVGRSRDFGESGFKKACSSKSSVHHWFPGPLDILCISGALLVAQSGTAATGAACPARRVGLTGSARGSVNSHDRQGCWLARKDGRVGCGRLVRGVVKESVKAGGERPACSRIARIQAAGCRCDGRFQGGFSRNMWVVLPIRAENSRSTPIMGLVSSALQG